MSTLAGAAGDIPAFIGDVVWTPPADTIARSELTRFMTAEASRTSRLCCAGRPGMRTVDTSLGNR